MAAPASRSDKSLPLLARLASNQWHVWPQPVRLWLLSLGCRFLCVHSVGCVARARGSIVWRRSSVTKAQRCSSPPCTALHPCWRSSTWHSWRPLCVGCLHPDAALVLYRYGAHIAIDQHYTDLRKYITPIGRGCGVCMDLQCALLIVPMLRALATKLRQTSCVPRQDAEQSSNVWY